MFIIYTSILILLRSLYHDSHLRCSTLICSYRDQIRRSPEICQQLALLRSLLHKI